MVTGIDTPKALELSLSGLVPVPVIFAFVSPVLLCHTGPGLQTATGPIPLITTPLVTEIRRADT